MRIPGETVGEAFPVTLTLDADEALLVGLLEEVIFVLDALGSVAVDVSLSDHEEKRVMGFLEIVPVEMLDARGPAPKGVSMEGLFFGKDDAGWRCRATIDV